MACLDENELLALGQGRLKGKALLAAQEHLDGCEECLNLLGLFQQSCEPAEMEASASYDATRVPLAPRSGIIEASYERASTSSEEFDLSLPTGTRIGRYAIIRAIGRGGMGVVYLAEDPELDRKVALKLVRPTLAEAERKEHFERRLKREAKAMARLTHPNVLTIYDVGKHGGQVFLASEWVDGTTLEAWVGQGEHSWNELSKRFLAAAKGLAAAHDAGLVHRDFKPSNVMIGKDGRLRVFDFGLVKGSAKVGIESTTQLSGNFVVGTPAYMAPEQMTGLVADARSDQFAFCVSLYESLANKRPFDGRNLVELLSSIREQKILPIDGVPKWLSDLVRRGLAYAPEDRYESMTEISEALQKGLTHRQRRGKILMASVGAAGVLGLGLFFAFPSDADKGEQAQRGEAFAAQVWNPSIREQVQEAFVQTELGFAQQAFAHSSERLDRYNIELGQAWDRINGKETIQNEHSTAVREAGRACLKNLRSDLGQVVRAFQGGGDEVVLHAHALVDALHPLSECSRDAISNNLRGSGGAPESQITREALYEIDLLLATQEYNAAVLLGRKTRKELQEGEPAWAQVNERLGIALKRLGRFEEALGFLEGAFYAGMANHDDLLAGRSAASVFHLLANELRDEERSRGWRRLAESAVHASLDAAELGRWKRILGAASLLDGAFEEAERLYRESLNIVTAGQGPFHRDVTSTWIGIGQSLSGLGDLEGARVALQKAVEISLAGRGGAHPDTAIARLQLAGALADLGMHEEASASALHAREDILKALGEDHPQSALALHSSAEFLLAQGKVEDAKSSLLRALAAKKKAYGEKHPRLASSLLNLADIARARSQDAEAIMHLRNASAILKPYADHPHYLSVKLLLAELLVQREEFSMALLVCEELEPTLASLDRLSKARYAGSLGLARLGLGQLEEGREALRSSLQLLGMEALGPRAAGVRMALGQALGRAVLLSQRTLVQKELAGTGPLWERERARAMEIFGPIER